MVQRGQSRRSLSLVVPGMMSEVVLREILNDCISISEKVEIRVVRAVNVLAVGTRRTTLVKIIFPSEEERQSAFCRIKGVTIDDVVVREGGTARSWQPRFGDLMVEGLASDVTPDELLEAFAPLGSVIEARMLPFGRGCVHLRNGWCAHGKCVVLRGEARLCLLRGRTCTGNRQPDTLLVTQLPPSVGNDAGLAALFAEFGSVSRAQLRLGEDGRLLGRVQIAEGAIQAIRAFNGRQMEGATLKVAPTRSFECAPDEETTRRMLSGPAYREYLGAECRARSLYVRGFGAGATEAMLTDAFAEFGEVESVYMSRRYGRHHGWLPLFAFVVMRRDVDAARCLRESTWSLVTNRPLHVASDRLAFRDPNAASHGALSSATSDPYPALIARLDPGDAKRRAWLRALSPDQRQFLEDGPTWSLWVERTASADAHFDPPRRRRPVRGREAKS